MTEEHGDTALGLTAEEMRAHLKTISMENLLLAKEDAENTLQIIIEEVESRNSE